MANLSSSGPFSSSMYAFYQQGVWAPTADPNGFELAQPVDNGDTQIVVNALNDGPPPVVKLNMFEPVLSPLPGVPGQGFGKLLRLDPSGVDKKVQIRGVNPFESVGVDLVIQLSEPISGLSAPIAAGALIAMGDSPVISVGALGKKVGLLGIMHGCDATGDNNGGAGYSTTPDIEVEVYGANDPNGTFALIGTIPVGAIPSTPGGPSEVSAYAEYTLPMLDFVFFRIVPQVGDGGNTLFSLQVMFGAK